jgi:GntR family transcriptional repressor for pyruvate dehydrogenase complex
VSTGTTEGLNVGEPASRPSFAVNSRALPKAAAILASQIRAQILGNGMESGSALPSEPELIAQSGLGRATVREAIRILEAEGLLMVKRGSNGGIFVATPDLSKLSHSLAPLLTLSKAPLRDLTTYRKMVEPSAAGLAASLASEEDRASLLKLAEHNPGPGYVNEVAFHERVADLSQNLLLRVLVLVPNDLLREHLKGEAIEEHDVEEANEAHVAIAKAIAAGDAERASRAMMRHLEAFEDRMGRAGRLDQPIIPQEQWLRNSSLGFGQ